MLKVSPCVVHNIMMNTKQQHDDEVFFFGNKITNYSLAYSKHASHHHHGVRLCVLDTTLRSTIV